VAASRRSRTLASSASCEIVGAVDSKVCGMDLSNSGIGARFAALLHELALWQPLRTNVRTPTDGRLNR